MIMAMPADVRRQLHSMAPVTLSQLQQTAPLRTRVDRKYVVDWAVLGLILEAVRATHRSLEIGGERVFRYESTYFDSADLKAFRAHMQGRRRRYKVRTRHYVDSDLRLFEVKLKGRRGETIKHQLPYRDEDLGQVSAHARGFLADLLAEAYPGVEIADLSAVLSNRYRRLTLATANERLTCDFDLHYADGAGEVLGLDAGHVIVESKCERGLGSADRLLRRLGVKPVACSKYCVGVALLREDVKVNDLRWLLRRYFSSQPRPTAGTTISASAHA